MTKFLAHARRQMARRGISEADVDLVLSAPEFSYPSSKEGRHVYVRSIGDRRIAVVVFDDERDRVITTFDQLSDD